MNHLTLWSLLMAAVVWPSIARGQSNRGTVPPASGGTQQTAGQQPPGQTTGQPATQQMPMSPPGSVQRPVGRMDRVLPSGAQPYAVGQNGGSNLFGYFGMPLYGNPDVSKTLGLTKEQIENLDLQSRRIQSSYVNQLPTLGVLTGPDGPSSLGKLRTNYQNELLANLSKIMSTEQLKRYRQLDLQYRGASALLDIDLRSKLHLDSEQIRKLCELDEKADVDLRSLLIDTRLTEEELQRRYQSLRERTKDKIEGILNKSQLDSWKNLRGDPFTFRMD